MVLKIFDSTLFSGNFFNNFHVAILSALQLKTFFLHPISCPVIFFYAACSILFYY